MKDNMMSAYETIKNAINNRQCVTANLEGEEGRMRRFSPHEIGQGKDDKEMAMMFQYDGYSSQGLPAGGMWRCMDVSRLRNVSVNGDAWHTNDAHSRPNTCVLETDVKVKN